MTMPLETADLRRRRRGAIPIIDGDGFANADDELDPTEAADLDMDGTGDNA